MQTMVWDGDVIANNVYKGVDACVRMEVKLVLKTGDADLREVH